MNSHSKSVGTIKHSNNNTPAKRFQSKISSFEPSLFHTNSSSSTKPSSDILRSHSRKRLNSVGKIYTTKYTKTKQQANNQVVLKKYGPSFINYNEIESKLSSYLQCTINTNCRLRYNYLSPYESPFNEQVNYHRTQTTNKPLLFSNKMNNNQTQKYYEDKTQKIVKPSKKNIITQEYIHSQNNKENINFVSATKKQSICMRNSIDHQQNKTKLQTKLKKMIEEYENKQKQLTTELKKIQQTNKRQPKTKQQANSLNKQQITQQNGVETNQFINEIFEKLLQFNLQAISLSTQIDSKSQQFWKYMHKQIVLDEHLRISKSFISTQNMEAVLKAINQNRIKKIGSAALMTSTDQYDPFLIQKLNEFSKNHNIKLTDNPIVKSIANLFIRSYEQSQRHWIKYFSHEQLQRNFRTINIQRQLNTQSTKENQSKDNNLRDLARYLSMLFKANLRNRNIYEIHTRLKQISFTGRFIQILQQKLQQKTEKTAQSKKKSCLQK